MTNSANPSIQSDLSSGVEAAWVTYLRAGCYVLPALATWFLFTIFIQPSALHYWMDTIVPEIQKLRWLFEFSRFMANNGRIVFAAILVGIVFWDFLFKPRAWQRQVVVGTVVIAINILVLVCLLATDTLCSIAQERLARLAQQAQPWTKDGEPWTISTDKIGTDFSIAGLADVPLGKEFEVVGGEVNDLNGAPKSLTKKWFEVVSVNGIQLKEPERIGIIGVDNVPEGVSFHLRVKEEAAFSSEKTPGVESGTPQDQQALTPSLRIIQQISPETPKLLH